MTIDEREAVASVYLDALSGSCPPDSPLPLPELEVVVQPDGPGYVDPTPLLTPALELVYTAAELLATQCEIDVDAAIFEIRRAYFCRE